MKQKLIEFLKQNDCLESFTKYVYDEWELDIEAYCNHTLTNKFNMFTGSFNWSNTEEGFDYWLDLDNEWIKWLKENDI